MQDCIDIYWLKKQYKTIYNKEYTKNTALSMR